MKHVFFGNLNADFVGCVRLANAKPIFIMITENIMPILERSFISK